MSANTIDQLDRMIAESRERLAGIAGYNEPEEAASASADSPAADSSPHAPFTDDQVEALGDLDLARFIDHTLLRTDAGPADFEELCRVAWDYGCAAVCVPPSWLGFCRERLAGGGVGLASVVGFPFGYNLTETKASEAEQLARAGTDELDMVLNAGWLKAGEDELVLADIAAVVAAAGPARVKVILETSLLTDEEKVRACLLCRAAGAEYVKTSTGFQGGGATVDDVALMRRAVGHGIGVKASGGVRDAAAARAMLRAGADRIGTSSTLAIVGQK